MAADAGILCGKTVLLRDKKKNTLYFMSETCCNKLIDTVLKFRLTCGRGLNVFGAEPTVRWQLADFARVFCPLRMSFCFTVRAHTYFDLRPQVKASLLMMT